MEENLKEKLGAKVGKQKFPEENLEVTVDDAYTFEITKEGEVKDKGTVTPTEEDKVIPGVIVEGSNKTYKDKYNKIAVIPVGFAVSEEEGEQVIDEGLVIKDSDGNEFVWIPVTDSNSYVKNSDYPKNFDGDIKNDTGYLPKGIEIGEPQGEKTLEDLTFEKEKEIVTDDMIEKYKVGGFYISRYEAGDGSAEANRTDSSGTIGKLVSKKDAYVYNYIKQTDAKEKAKEFTEEDNANIKSGLCTGIQWDMIMEFVDEKKDGMNQTYDVEMGLESRHHSSGVEQSGQNLADKVCNIYDLEGNCCEYIAEKSTEDTSISYVKRGGSFLDCERASWRSFNLDDSVDFNSFRFVLYVM